MNDRWLGLTLAIPLFLAFNPVSGAERLLGAIRVLPTIEISATSGGGKSITTKTIKIKEWKKKARRHAPDLDEDADVIRGDHVIEEGEVFEGDLVVIGNLDVYGEVEGDAVAFGDVYLGPKAVIGGDAVAFGGDLEQEEGSEVRGDVVEVWQKMGISVAHEKAGTLFPKREDGKVLFRYRNPRAREVFLVGDFNDWDQEADPMERAGDVWELEKEVEEGRYEYAFFVDENLVPDPSHPDVTYTTIVIDEDGDVDTPTHTVQVHFVETYDWDFDTRFRYNRVDGFYLPTRLEFMKRGTYLPRLSGEYGYAFARKKALGEVEIDQPILGSDNGLSLGFNYHENTYSHDHDTDVIGFYENTAAALFLKEDFRDYYEKKGATVFANVRAGSHNNLRVEYRRDDLRSLPKATDWAFFGDRKCFDCNPSLFEGAPFCDARRLTHCTTGNPCSVASLDLGTMRSVYARYILDLRNDRDNPTRGLYLRLTGERAGGGDLRGDYEFAKYWVDFRNYIRLSLRQYLDIRIMAGSSDIDNPLPVFKEYYVGGIGTLTARRFKEFRGNRVLLGSVEYRVGLSDDFQGVFFVDSGDAWYKENRDYDIKTDVGLALQDSDCDFRVSYSKKSEDLSDEGVWMLRVNKPF